MFSEDAGPTAISTRISFPEFRELMEHVKPAKKLIRMLPGKEEYLEYYRRVDRSAKRRALAVVKQFMASASRLKTRFDIVLSFRAPKLFEVTM